MIIDGFNRVHNYLRISMTDNCNLRCFYCMPEEDYEFTPASRLMQPDEIESIAKIFVSQGVNKIRLTGGEPLVRKDAADIILRLSKLPVNLTITTNGTRLHDFTDVLENAGVNSLNISLDTLNKEKFNLMTRRDQFERVVAEPGEREAAIECGHDPSRDRSRVAAHATDAQVRDFSNDQRAGAAAAVSLISSRRTVKCRSTGAS